MEDIIRQVLPHLPPNLQAIVLDPPSFSRPTTFWPVIKLLLPYAKYVVVILAFYIVWSVVAGVLGYFTRFLRFAFRFAPILMLIAWIMSSSGQGSMEETFEIVKQYLGLSNQAQGGGPLGPGIASLANLFSGDTKSSGRTRKGKTSSSFPFSSFQDSNGPSTRSKTKRSSSSPNKLNDPSVGDVWSSVLESAAGVVNRGEDWQEAVQGFVKQSLRKAVGIDWLLGIDKEEADRGRTRRR